MTILWHAQAEFDHPTLANVRGRGAMLASTTMLQAYQEGDEVVGVVTMAFWLSS